MRKKLRERRGETLVELLASILIGALSAALLAGGIAASTRLDLDARDLDKTYYQQLTAAEARTGPALPGTVEVVNTKNGLKSAIPVNVWGGGRAWSYSAEGGGP
jgi:type II secretory pathway pseudopilin PulG